MFNLSAPGNVGYNGISQLADVRCSGRGLRAFLQEGTGTEDVYTFREAEPTPTARPRPPARPSPPAPPPLPTLNGRSSPPRLHNGLHSPHTRDALPPGQSKVFQPGRLTVKRNRDLFATSPSGALGREIDSAPTADGDDEGLNRSTKNSIISYSISPLRVAAGSHSSRKAEAREVFRRSAELVVPPGPVPRRLPSGKPTPVRGTAGRGPELHEALQRISGPTWHAAPTQLLDLAPLPLPRTLSADEDDCPSAHVEEWWGDAPRTGRARRLAARRAALRRRVSQVQRHAACLQPPPAAAALCQAAKVQLAWREARLSGRALELLLALRGAGGLLPAADRRRLRCGPLVGAAECSVPGCDAAALACARLCLQHVTHSPEQRLFTECTAKFSDNTQCRRPVVNIAHELPLCAEHAWKRDNYNKMSQESKPKKAPRKRPKPSAMIRPQKRSRRRRRGAARSPARGSVPSCPSPPEDSAELNVCSTSSACESSEDTGLGALSESEFASSRTEHIVDSAVVAQVLGMRQELLPTSAPPEPSLDLNTVFSDFFAVEPNGEYIPTHEETEELERALEAVNQDVKSLEKLTGSQHTLLESLLDETLAETLASLPDVFSPRSAPS